MNLDQWNGKLVPQVKLIPNGQLKWQWDSTLEFHG